MGVIFTLSAVVAAVKQGWVPSYLPIVTKPGTNLWSNSKVKTGLIELFIFKVCLGCSRLCVFKKP